MTLPLAYYGEPILRKKTQPVQEITQEIKQLVEKMFEAMHHYNGMGLAAPQVFHSLSLFVMCVPVQVSEKQWIPGTSYVFINPKLIEHSNEQWLQEEGCLSIPNLRGEVPRPNTIKVEALDLEGNTFTKEFSGWEARCILHEMDHLNGVLFIDRMHKKERKLLEPVLRKIKKKFYKKT